MPATAETVSVIVPVFNGERYIGEALDSILAQSRSPGEIIVVDDGSTDGTPEVLATYRGLIRTHRHDVNRGVAAARNTGLGLATGSLLAFLDADDLWAPVKLERQLATLSADPASWFVLSRIENLWEPDLGPIPDRIRAHPASQARPGYYFQTMLAHRSAFDAIGYLDESLRTAEDLDWFMRAIEKHARYQVVPEILVVRRMHHSNLTGLGGGDQDRHLLLLQHSLQRRRLGAIRPDVQAPQERSTR